MEVPPFEGDILLLPPPDPPVSYTVTSEASSNLLYGGLPLSQLRRDEYSEVTSQTNDVVFLLIAREALCVGGPRSQEKGFFHFYGESFFFFFTDDSTFDLICVYCLRTGGKVRIIFLNS